ncbi:MAG: imidazole glycerol phosphate synthase subunit HisH [Pseudomonadota bacterium]|jgi:glutamine amidotransferase|nr:imidazole glycerol phosphate synthase subunit HisH [Alphaproteobacteria bacterium]
MKKPTVAIIYSGYGNIIPIINILKMNAIPYKVIEHEDNVTEYDKIIIPGVGAFDPFIEKLKSKGLDQIILTAWQNNKPILGICIGAQILGKSSEEGNLKGLGILDMDVKKFNIENNNIRIPHMGWNQVNALSSSSLLSEIDEDHRFYFVHSYHFVTNQQNIVLSTTQHGYDFPSIIADNNVYAVQFHPEKSQKHGMQLLKNFSLSC